MKVRKSKQKRFIAGDFRVIDEMTGMEIRASESGKRWDNVIMRADLVDPRHPQDFLRGTKEVIGTPWARTEPENNYTNGTNTADKL